MRLATVGLDARGHAGISQLVLVAMLVGLAGLVFAVILPGVGDATARLGTSFANGNVFAAMPVSSSESFSALPLTLDRASFIDHEDAPSVRTAGGRVHALGTEDYDQGSLPADFAKHHTAARDQDQLIVPDDLDEAPGWERRAGEYLRNRLESAASREANRLMIEPRPSWLREEDVPGVEAMLEGFEFSNDVRRPSDGEAVMGLYVACRSVGVDSDTCASRARRLRLSTFEVRDHRGVVGTAFLAEDIGEYALGTSAHVAQALRGGVAQLTNSQVSFESIRMRTHPDYVPTDFGDDLAVLLSDTIGAKHRSDRWQETLNAAWTMGDFGETRTPQAGDDRVLLSMVGSPAGRIRTTVGELRRFSHAEAVIPLVGRSGSITKLKKDEELVFVLTGPRATRWDGNSGALVVPRDLSFPVGMYPGGFFPPGVSMLLHPSDPRSATSSTSTSATQLPGRHVVPTSRVVPGLSRLFRDKSIQAEPIPD